MKITKFQKTILKWIFTKIFKQGWYHKSNLEEVYSLIRETLNEEFTEDNYPTLDAFTIECFGKSVIGDYLVAINENTSTESR